MIEDTRGITIISQVQTLQWPTEKDNNTKYVLHSTTQNKTQKIEQNEPHNKTGDNSDAS